MEKIITEQIQLYGAQVAILLAFAYIIAKILLKHGLRKDLEDHKASLTQQKALFESELRHAHSTEIAKLDAELKQRLAEHQLRDARIYEKRELILGEIHKALVQALELSHDVISPSIKRPVREALDALDEILMSFKEREYYFSLQFCEKVYVCIGNLKSSLIEFDATRDQRTDNWEQDRLELKQAVNNFSEALRAIRTELVDEIRKLIGTYGRMEGVRVQ
ncbi:MAG: hypothetical protein GVY36_17045 [Verrucomicrobia bacterium]|jgi:hypothetical protein|nr:hypothetical protein [Verrucomicrobiota bacterium]